MWFGGGLGFGEGCVFGSSLMDICSSSSSICSTFTFMWFAGGCPAASHFLLLRQKKVTKEKATRSLGPFGHLAVLKPGGVTCKLAALRQARALIRPVLRSSAQPGRVGGKIRSRERSPLSPRLSSRTIRDPSPCRLRAAMRVHGLRIKSTTVRSFPQDSNFRS